MRSARLPASHSTETSRWLTLTKNDRSPSCAMPGAAWSVFRVPRSLSTQSRRSSRNSRWPTANRGPSRFKTDSLFQLGESRRFRVVGSRLRQRGEQSFGIFRGTQQMCRFHRAVEFVGRNHRHGSTRATAYQDHFTIGQDYCTTNGTSNRVQREIPEGCLPRRGSSAYRGSDGWRQRPSVGRWPPGFSETR